MVWLTPAMDGLFHGRGSERRRSSTLVLAIDSEHSSRVSALTAPCAAQRLLEVHFDDHWARDRAREPPSLRTGPATRGQTALKLAAMLRRAAGIGVSAAEIARRRMENTLSEPATPSRTATENPAGARCATQPQAAPSTVRISPICR